jgi:pimeloyl-ACP methyl ester carboxylesterase
MQRFLIMLLTLLVISGLAFAFPSRNEINLPARSAHQRQNIAGNWDAVLSVSGNNLRLVLKISATAEDALKATVDSLDQPGAMDLPVDTITFKGGALHFEMPKLFAVYDGTLSRDGSEIVGTWKQGGNRFSLNFRKPGQAQSTAPVQRGRVQLKPCINPALTKDALCGKYEVFEDRDAKTGRKIALNMILLPALSAKPAPDAVFYLVGGPGGAATASATAGFMTRLRGERDVVLVDQRGTGASNPLNCNFHGDKTHMQGYFDNPLDVAKVRACREELEKVANLKLYVTSIAMDDLDEVRAALGYDKINVYGGSYGSTTSLVYLRQHPEHVRTVTVSSVAPPDAKLPLSFAKGVQNATNRLFEDCAADSACNAAFPKFREEFDAVLKQFDKGPVEVTTTNVYTRQQEHVTLTRDAFVEDIRLMLYVPNAMSSMPLLIHLAATGNFGPFVSTAFQIASQIYGLLSQGMQLSVVCSEDVPFITEADVKRDSAGSFYGDMRVRTLQQACAQWPQAKVPASFLNPVKSNVPVLLISGEIDPVTPPWLAESAARSLSNSRHVVIHNATHTFYECTENLAADFIEKGSVQGLDTSCIEQIKRPPFNIPRAQ